MEEGGNKMFIDPRLENLLEVSRDISNLLYYKSPYEAVVKKVNGDAKSEAAIISVKSYNSDMKFNEKGIRNLIVEKLRDFDVLKDLNCTAMGIGPITLFSFEDQSIRMDLKEVENEQMEIPLGVNGLETINAHVVEIFVGIRDTFHYDNRFFFLVPFQSPVSESKISFYIITSKDNTGVSKTFKVTLSVARR